MQCAVRSAQCAVRTEREAERGRGAAVGARGREGHVRVAGQRARQRQVVGRAPHVLQRLQLVQPRARQAHAAVHVLHRLRTTRMSSLIHAANLQASLSSTVLDA